MELEQSAPDFALATIVSIVNRRNEREERGVGVILALSGLVVCGKIIPNWQWHEDVEKQLLDAQAQAGEDTEGESPGWAFLFSQLGQEAAQSRDEARAAMAASEELAERYGAALAQQDRTSFIHLQHTRILMPGQAGVPSGGMHWRGRLADVNGWAIGELSYAS